MSARLHLRTPAGNSWPPLPRGENDQLWAAFLALEESQWLPPEEIEARQVAQLRVLLAHCRDHVPYYRELMRAHSIAPEDIQCVADLRRLPMLSRATCQDAFARLQAERLPPAMTRISSLHTSGSSGMPLEVIQTNLVQFLWGAFNLRDIVWSELDSTATLAIIRGTPPEWRARALEGVSFPEWAAHLGGVLETGPCHVMDIHQEPRRQLEWLASVGPAYLVSYPTNVDALARIARDEGLRLPTLRMIRTFAETLTEAMAERISDAFGVPVKASYTCNEAGYLASPCPDGHGLHVHSEHVVLEVLDERDQPCTPGQVGRVVLTTLHNFAMPFIRYDVMDDAEVGAPCACGRGLPTLTRVVGKQRPFLWLPDGRRKHSAALARLFHKELDGIRQFQVVQRAPDRVVVNLVPDAAWTVEHPARIVSGVQAFFEAPVRVDVVLADHLERSAAGKVRDFVIECEPPGAR